MKTYEEAVAAFAEKITIRRTRAYGALRGIYRAEVEYENRVYTADICSFMGVVYDQVDPEKVFEDIIAVCGYPNERGG
jgi:hypothetical protein